MTIGVLTALHRRPEVSRLCLSSVSSLETRGVRYVRLAVGSEKSDEDLARSCGWGYIEAPNDPLSDKWNAGARALRGVDALVVVGSDNLLSRAYWERLPHILRKGKTFAYLDTAHYIDTKTGECVKAPVGYVGAGRVLSKELLNRMDWTPWKSGLNDHLDRSMSQRILEHDPYAGTRWYSFPHSMVPDAVVVDLKSEVNIWSFQQRMMMDRTYPADGEALMEKYFPNEAQAIYKEEAHAYQ